MNRTILIVICDFLLVSLLAFSTVDINKVTEENTPRQVRVEIATNSVETPGKDLAAVMRLALNEEQQKRDQLLGELTRTRETATQQQALLTEREHQVQSIQKELLTREQLLQSSQKELLSRDQQLQSSQKELQSRDQQLQSSQKELQAREQQAEALQKELQARQQKAEALQKELQARQQKAEALQKELQTREQQLEASQKALQAREQQVQTFQKELQSRDQQVQAFQKDLAAREQQARDLQLQQTNLQQQFAASQANIQSLNQQVKGVSTEAILSKERLAATEADLRKQIDQAAALQAQLAALAKSNQLVVAEQQRLSTQLQLAEADRRHAAEQVYRMQEEVKIEREEKAKLADGVKTLAAQSSQLAQEIRENRPIASNTIFDEFLTNRVQASFFAVRPGLFGEASRSSDTQTVLVTDGTNHYALCHVQDTPLTFFSPGTEWEGLTATLGRNMAQLKMNSMAFGWPDPRVVILPVSATDARQLGCKVYRISTEPYKFQDAVLVGARDGYYGECRFQIDPTTPDYVKLDRNFLKGLFGKFNPSRGDLVFSKQGELLGIMANNSYCMMVRKFEATAIIKFSQDVRAQHTGETLSRLYAFVTGLPMKLQ